LWCTGARVNSIDVHDTSSANEHAEGSSQKRIRDRGREGALGEDADALVSLQRQSLDSLPIGGEAGWNTILALSQTRERFVGRDSMKMDKEEVMAACMKMSWKKMILYELC
jgi:hypothetical protein